MRLALLGCIGLMTATTALAQPLPGQASQAQHGPQVAANGVVPAAAAPVATGNPLEIRSLRDLATACSMRNDNPYYVAATSLCAGYEAAVLDFHLLDTMGPRHNKRKVCLPNPAPSRRQTTAGLVSWVQSNPQYLDEPAASGVLRYFINNYPCNRKTFQWSPPGPMQ